jgi:hypothetical protein
MPEISPVPKQDSAVGMVASGLGSVVRTLSNPGQRSKMGKGLMAGGSAFLRASAKAAHLLWLEVTGFFFLCFAVIGSFATIREYRAYTAGKPVGGKVVMGICFTLMFLYFGLSSFFRARGRRSS